MKERIVNMKVRGVDSTEQGRDRDGMKRGKDVDSMKQGKDEDSMERGKDVDSTEQGKDASRMKQAKDVDTDMIRSYCMEDCCDREEWDAFVTAHPEANFLQSWDFYEFHRRRGKRVVRRVARMRGNAVQDEAAEMREKPGEDEEGKDNKGDNAAVVNGGDGRWEAIERNDNGSILAAYAGVVETAKRGRHLAIAGGPILDWEDSDLVREIFLDMRLQGEREQCVFVRVRPQLELSEKSLKIMRKNGLVPAPMYLSVEYAGILNLEKSEEEILRGASQGFRRKLRKAEKNGIQIEKSTNPADIHEFYEIQLQTASRHDFVAFSEDFFTKQFAAFAEHGEAVLYTARMGSEEREVEGAGVEVKEKKRGVADASVEGDGEILAQNFMIFYGDEASYHYGVSSDLGTKYSAAPLLHLEAMRDARKRGIKRYNLWGIVDLDDTQHRFYGVSQFKRSFGVEELKYTPAHDLILKPVPYQITKMIEKMRKRVRHV